MKILVACEESQAVTIELRNLGHEAYSCDLVECSGGHPEWHIMQDVLFLLNGSCCFKTMDGTEHRIEGKWDMIIAFPPCTDLAVSGARHFAQKRADGRQQRSIEFFMAFANADCDRIAIENPIGIMSTQWRKPDQIIQPWQFGHGETKATCLWLKNLPKLEPTEIVDGREQRIWKMPPSADRAKLRSKTFPGIAKAMAEQWAGHVGRPMDKLDIAVKRIKEASDMSLYYYEKPLLLTYSGGKNSDAVREVAKIAGIPYEIQRSHTTADAPKVFFVCDRLACDNCSPECFHTSDVTHAANFRRLDEYYWEGQREENSDAD